MIAGCYALLMSAFFGDVFVSGSEADLDAACRLACASTKCSGPWKISSALAFPAGLNPSLR